jgi:hypothetical protein
MDNITLYFRAFLSYISTNEGRGFNTRLGNLVGVGSAYIGKLINGTNVGPETIRRKIAHVLGYNYENFLDRGRAIIEGKNPDSLDEDPDGLTGDELRERGFITVPFSDNMKLAAGSGGTIPITDDVGRSKIIVHAQSLGRTSHRNLQAFMVGGDSMEPLIAQGGIVLADISENQPQRLKEGKIYVLCWDIQEGECAVKFIRWAERNKSVIISSPSNELYPPIVRKIDEINLIGRVIWAWRDFK